MWVLDPLGLVTLVEFGFQVMLQLLISDAVAALAVHEGGRHVAAWDPSDVFASVPNIGSSYHYRNPYIKGQKR